MNRINFPTGWKRKESETLLLTLKKNAFEGFVC